MPTDHAEYAGFFTPLCCERVRKESLKDQIDTTGIVWSSSFQTTDPTQNDLLDIERSRVVSKYLLYALESGVEERNLSKQITIDGAVSGARMAGEERRLQILRVAVSLFSERGFRGTTTREIALAAGVSEAMVFRHFATKEELYAAILDHKACSGGKFQPAEMAADGDSAQRRSRRV